MRVFHFLKEKVNLKELWNRVCSLEPNKKVKIVVVFLAVMVGITIISRVTYQMILPKVVMGQADYDTPYDPYTGRSKIPFGIPGIYDRRAAGG